MRLLNLDKDSYLYLTFLITIKCVQLYHNTLSCKLSLLLSTETKSRFAGSCKLRSEVTKSRSAGSTDINQFLVWKLRYYIKYYRHCDPEDSGEAIFIT